YPSPSHAGRTADLGPESDAETTTGCMLLLEEQESQSDQAHTSSFPRQSQIASSEICMPSLSPTMSEGTIVKWYKKEGDVINAGDVLCDVQTDKAVVSFDTEDDGILAKILKPENTTDIKVGALIAIMVEEGDDWQNVEYWPFRKKVTGRVWSSCKRRSGCRSTRQNHKGTTIPHSYATMDCNVGPVTALRKQLIKDSIKRVPQVNSVWQNDEPASMLNVDICVAVATDNGLITPIVQNTPQLAVDEISSTVKNI
ncbi:ODPX-like protein, partial [Mya arenaria]